MSLAELRRSDATLVRLTSVALGTGLAVVWVAAISTGATTWLTWMAALAALACFGTVSLVPERRAGLIAAANLGFVAVVLATCWIVGMATSSTTWLLWSCFAATTLTWSAALLTAFLALYDQG